jgi:hypothetical protein
VKEKIIHYKGIWKYFTPLYWKLQWNQIMYGCGYPLNIVKVVYFEIDENDPIVKNLD